MNAKKHIRKILGLLLMTVLAFGTTSLLASPDDERGNRNDDRGSSEERGSGRNEDRGGGGSGSRDALSADFIPIPPTKGKGDGQIFEFSGGNSTALNADVRLALEKLDDDGNTLAILNTHLGIDRYNYSEAVITLFIGTDEDGDGSCLTEGPTSICVLGGGGSQDLMVNPDNILHAAWAIALRDDGDKLRGSGTCWSNFQSTEVVPQFDENGNMTSVVFNIQGGEEMMPEIEEDDGSMVGFGASWLGFDCEDYSKGCQIIPVMMGLWED
ncbi:MAG: hypothetical protein P8Z31_00080 [Gammaproteobacteria bacterium]|jgi:hypothetical protein